MQRRNFFLGSAALTATMMGGVNNSIAQTVDACLTPAPAPLPVGGINAVAEIKALRIPTGAYAGAYEISPNGLSNWYFTNLGQSSWID